MKEKHTHGLPDTGAEILETGVDAAAAGQKDMGRDRLSWEEILQDEEYRACFDRTVQGIVQRRLRKRQEAESRLESLLPLLDALARRYGPEAQPEDIAGLILAEIEKQEQSLELLWKHLQSLVQQEAELKESFPDFELDKALEEPLFLRLTAPHTGLGLADAWYALHRAEIGAAAARESLEAISRSIRSGGLRPRELGDSHSGQGFSTDPRSMNRAEREALKKRIYAAGALKQKIYP